MSFAFLTIVTFAQILSKQNIVFSSYIEETDTTMTKKNKGKRTNNDLQITAKKLKC